MADNRFSKQLCISFLYVSTHVTKIGYGTVEHMYVTDDEPNQASLYA